MLIMASVRAKVAVIIFRLLRNRLGVSSRHAPCQVKGGRIGASVRARVGVKVTVSLVIALEGITRLKVR